MQTFKRALALVAVVGFLVVSLPAQEQFTTPLIPREVLFGNPERANPQISPDGTQLGYLAPVDGVLNHQAFLNGRTRALGGAGRDRCHLRCPARTGLFHPGAPFAAVALG